MNYQQLFSIVFLALLITTGCKQPKAPDRRASDSRGSVRADPVQTTASQTPLAGTWVRHGASRFDLIEIIDTAHVIYYSYIRHKDEPKQIPGDRYWYYKSKATLGHWNDSTIWISTDMFRFDYRVQGDTLVEFDKMGDQGDFIRVLTDEQKRMKDPQALYRPVTDRWIHLRYYTMTKYLRVGHNFHYSDDLFEYEGDIFWPRLSSEYRDDTLSGAAVYKPMGAMDYTKADLLNDTLFLQLLDVPEVRRVELRGKIRDNNRSYPIDNRFGDSVFRIDGDTLYLYDFGKRWIAVY